MNLLRLLLAYRTEQCFHFLLSVCIDMENMTSLLPCKVQVLLDSEVYSLMLLQF